MGRIIPINIEEQMKSAYIDYSMSVIVSRALPDVRDGLKPVHRRILYDMSAESSTSIRTSPPVSRRVSSATCWVSSIPTATCRFTTRWCVWRRSGRCATRSWTGRGNFGSMDGDSPAAMRYTEARMKKITDEVMADIDKETVDWTLNFDDTIPEPTVLPTKIPLLIVNGASGIAVGMATNMAPHNLSEVVDACCAYVDNPEITGEELLHYVKGPRLPHGRHHLRLRGCQGGDAHRPRPRGHARQDRNRAHPVGPRVHRDNGDSLHDQQGRNDPEDRRHDQRQEDRRHLLHQRRVGPQRPADHHHPQARCRGERSAQHAVQEYALADVVRREQHRAGERAAAVAVDARPDPVFHRTPPRRGGAPHAFRQAQGRGAAAHRAGSAHRAGQYRRDRADHPLVEDARRGEADDDGAFRTGRHPGFGHYRDASARPHGTGARQGSWPSGTSDEDSSPTSRRCSRTFRCRCRSSRTNCSR